MTALQLYKFIEVNNIEWRWDIKNDKDNVLVWIPFYLLDDFNKLLPDHVFDGWSADCTLRDYHIILWMEDICYRCDVDMNEIFDKKQDNEKH